MADSDRRRQLKVDVTPEVRSQLKREALDEDISIKVYLNRIMSFRLPWSIMNKLDARAKLEGLDGRSFLLKVLKEAGVLD